MVTCRCLLKKKNYKRQQNDKSTKSKIVATILFVCRTRKNFSFPVKLPDFRLGRKFSASVCVWKLAVRGLASPAAEGSADTAKAAIPTPAAEEEAGAESTG